MEDRWPGVSVRVRGGSESGEVEKRGGGKERRGEGRRGEGMRGGGGVSVEGRV